MASKVFLFTLRLFSVGFERRVASELALKLSINISPRTIRAYSEELGPSHRRDSQRWMTFVRNHAKAMVACDFAVTVTLGSQILYLFVVMDLGTRRLLHVNTTPHPSSAWTQQQLREAILSDHRYRWLIRDRSGIFSVDLDRSVEAFGVAVLKTPVRAPKAKDYASHCTSWVRCDTTLFARRRWDSFTPWAFRGGLSPGCSYR